MNGLSGGSFYYDCYGKLESAGTGEGDPLVNSEGTRVGNKLGIYYGEVLGITLRGAERSKLGGDE